MSNKKVEKIIKKLNNDLAKNFDDFDGIYFYGSRAGEINSSDSDIDIVAVFKEINRSKRMDIWGIIGKIEAEFDVFLDLHPMTKEELERNPIYYDQVVNKGIFYEAAA